MKTDCSVLTERLPLSSETKCKLNGCNRHH